MGVLVSDRSISAGDKGLIIVGVSGEHLGLAHGIDQLLWLQYC